MRGGPYFSVAYLIKCEGSHTTLPPDGPSFPLVKLLSSKNNFSSKNGTTSKEIFQRKHKEQKTNMKKIQSI